MRNKKSQQILYKAGFTEEQVVCLDKLRETYVTKEMYIAPAERRRMEFMRWLVSTRRITELLS